MADIESAQGPTGAAEGQGMAPAEVYTGEYQRKRGSRIPTLVWLLLLVAMAVGGAGAGYYYATTHPENGPSFGTLGGKTTIDENELDEVVATYTMGGVVHEITAREAILQESSLELARVGESAYLMPSTESVVSAARTAILQDEVDRRGITVSDEELDTYVKDTFGTTDYAALASEYHMDEENVRRLLRGSAGMAKLRAEVVADAETGASEPAAPTAPENGDKATASADYATYIIALAGDEWDAENGGWVNFDGPYAAALREYDVRADSAPYAAAEVAYNLAYEQYHSTPQVSASTVWSNYVNELLCQANLAVGSLVS